MEQLISSRHIVACAYSLWVTDVDSMIYDGRSSPALFSGQTAL